MDGIRNALETIRTLANEYLENLDHSGDEWVVLANITNHDNTINPLAQDKIIMCVYNITRETIISTYQPVVSGTDTYSMVSPPLYLDLHLMFMANFSNKNYTTGLAALSRLIGFFQTNPWFDQTNAPSLASDLGRLTLEFENLAPVDVNYVMGMFGTRYFPSTFYKLRLIPFTATSIRSRAYAVHGDNSDTTASDQ